MQYEKVYAFVLNKLETGLPSYLTYHNATHTKYVLNAAVHLAKSEQILGDDLILIKTAALFHDTGFLQHHENHEEYSCSFAQKILPGYDYSNAQIEMICKIIMATKLPQSPQNNFGEILADADLFYFGSEDYIANAEKLFKEFCKLEIVKTQQEWDLKQSEFLSAHKYFTQTAINEREQTKQTNLLQLKAKIESTRIPDHKKNKSA